MQIAPSVDWVPASLADVASPAFRLTAYFPYQAAHPYVLTEAWEALFACFEPIIHDRCDRVRMWDKPGAKARRSKVIQTADWHPFTHLKAVYSDVEHGIYTGFSFADRADDADLSGRGPCAFRFMVKPVIQLDATIAVEDWRDGRLDLDATLGALQALPFISFVAGYGLCLSERFAEGDRGSFLGQMIPVARRLPALDIMHADARAWIDGDESNFAQMGLAGVNWITGIGEPFFSKGGKAKLSEGLPTGISSETGKNGIIFRIGDKPITGEAGVDDGTLPLYQALGTRLKTLWSPNSRLSPVFGDHYARESLAWERRFFDGAGR